MRHARSRPGDLLCVAACQLVCRPCDSTHPEDRRIETRSLSHAGPITFCRLVDPVVASDGHTYERSAIAAVIESGNQRSPLTREMLEAYLTPNRALHRRMRAYEAETLQVAHLAAAEAQRAQQRQGAPQATAVTPRGSGGGDVDGAAAGGEDAAGEPGTVAAARGKRGGGSADAEAASSDGACASGGSATKRARLDDDAG